MAAFAILRKSFVEHISNERSNAVTLGIVVHLFELIGRCLGQRLVTQVKQSSGGGNHFTTAQFHINAAHVNPASANLEDERVSTTWLPGHHWRSHESVRMPTGDK